MRSKNVLTNLVQNFRTSQVMVDTVPQIRCASGEPQLLHTSGNSTVSGEVIGYIPSFLPHPGRVMSG